MANWKAKHDLMAAEAQQFKDALSRSEAARQETVNELQQLRGKPSEVNELRSQLEESQRRCQQLSQRGQQLHAEQLKLYEQTETIHAQAVHFHGLYRDSQRKMMAGMPHAIQDRVTDAQV